MRERWDSGRSHRETRQKGGGVGIETCCAGQRSVAPSGMLCHLGARRATLGALSLAPRYVGGSLAKGKVAWSVGEARGRCGVWRFVLGSSSRVWLEVPVGRGDALLFSLERLSERGQV